LTFTVSRAETWAVGSVDSVERRRSRQVIGQSSKAERKPLREESAETTTQLSITNLYITPLHFLI
jgi:hypothetical protein